MLYAALPRRAARRMLLSHADAASAG